uniref:protein-serine/threonine phosphatase n=1 Tax=Leptobrachium leishanense TaxID=445787 RepID=A0A8C5PEW6_9ANUR
MEQGAAGIPPPGEDRRLPRTDDSPAAPPPTPPPPAGPSAASSALLLRRRRRRLKRNLSCTAPQGAPSPGHGTRSLDRKSLLKPRQWVQLQTQEREWVRGELRRGCIHVYERHASPGLRPLLCTLDTPAGEVAARLLRPGGAPGSVLRVLGPPESAPHKLSRKEGCWVAGTGEESRGAAAVCQGLELFHCGAASSSSSSSVEELARDPADSQAVTVPARPLQAMKDAGPLGALYVQLHGESGRRLEPHEKPLQVQNDYLFQLGFRDLCRVQEEGMEPEIGCLVRFYAGLVWLLSGAGIYSSPNISNLHSASPNAVLISFWRHRVEFQSSGKLINSVHFSGSGKPNESSISHRTQLCGTYNVRKGKMQLPVNRWTRRQVILCGTCLIVSSVKESQTGKMHILPLIGGKVEEVKKHQHCLAFISSGPQSQTYYVCFDSFTDYLRWLRQASKIASQRISSVDLSCCSLELLPENLFYSQDLTHLNLKQNVLRVRPSLALEGNLDDLQRFTKLKSLNLANNNLGELPLAVCSIPTLTELNLSCNALREIPPSVGDMSNLQTFLLDGNYLKGLPVELANLHQLSYLGLSFNEFTDIPEVLEDMAAMDRLCMPGNALDILQLQTLRRTTQIKHIDLRLNMIRSFFVDEADFLLHITQLDLRNNHISELDVTALSNLEVLHCERNRLTSLKISGYFLKALYASSNDLTQLDVYPVPCHLTYMDISRNCLDCLPEWVSESKNLEVLDVRHNHLSELPTRLFCASNLRKLLAGYNCLVRLPDCIERTQLEIVDVQHNCLMELPSNLLLKSDSLRCLNASANSLETLPAACLSEDTRSVLQELYLSNNNLTDKCVPLLTGHPHLKILHMAYNLLQTFPASKMAKLEELEEIDISGNKLKALPTTIMNCRRMHTVIAHSNCLEAFPEVMQLAEIKCVDLSCNELTEITLAENLPLALQELDLTGNPRLLLDHKTLEVLKLCVASLLVNNFCDNREAVYGVFDGERNAEVPSLLQCTMSDILADELQKNKNEEEYMGNTFLAMQRKLGTAGQKMGGSAVLCHIKHDPIDPSGCFTLTSANVGKCQTVLCRDGKALNLSKSYTVNCEEELQRVKRHKAIITEDGKVNGVTDCTRILGYSFLHPSVTPRPHVQSVALTPQDEFFILGSKGLWDSLSEEEAVEAVRNVPDPLAASKKLCSLAQSYGCSTSLCAVVVQLNVTEDCFCCCELNGGIPPPSPGIFTPSVNVVIKDRAQDSLGMPSSSSGLASEISSEISTSEMSSEVGSTASDEPPAVSLHENSIGPVGCQSEQRCTLHPVCLSSSFQRQLSSATFSSAFSDNGLDSEDEEPIEGVFSNGSRVEVEVDIHCSRAKNGGQATPASVPEPTDEGIVISANEDDTGGTCKKQEFSNTLGRQRRANGSVAPLEKSHNLIEVAADAPLRKTGGYFAAPAQPDPDDQFIIPPELEEEVKEIMKQHQEQQQQQQLQQQQQQLQQQQQHRQYQMDQLPDYYDTPL